MGHMALILEEGLPISNRQGSKCVNLSTDAGKLKFKNGACKSFIRYPDGSPTQIWKDVSTIEHSLAAPDAVMWCDVMCCATLCCAVLLTNARNTETRIVVHNIAKPLFCSPCL